MKRQAANPGTSKYLSFFALKMTETIIEICCSSTNNSQTGSYRRLHKALITDKKLGNPFRRE